MNTVVVNSYESNFTVEFENLQKVIKKEGWQSVKYFLDNYTYDDGEDIYNICRSNGYVIDESLTNECLRKLIKEDYIVRNENPCFLKHDYLITIYSYKDGMYITDCSIDAGEFSSTIEEVENMLLSAGFKSIGLQTRLGEDK